MAIFEKREIKDIVPEAYLDYAAYVIQSRALPDSRDFLKKGGRYILWSQYFNKNTYDKNRKKGADVAAAVMHWNPHGDAGIYGNIVRFAKPFSYRYLLEDPKGNVGTICKGTDYAAPRYLELRSSKLASEFFNLIEKNTVDKWAMNYTNEDEYPTVLPTLFPNFVNGNVGIGVGCIGNSPTYNLGEAIESLKKLVKNRDCDFEDIYIEPDFPSGAIIINKNQIKESLKKGEGPSIKTRAVIEYNEKENSLIVKQLPYQVFTNTVMNEIKECVENNEIPGIKSFYDGTDRACGPYGCKIEIYLNKGTNPAKVCRLLYKKTSLQSFFVVKQLVLENGITPKLYGQKDIMLSFLNHSMNCLRKAYQFDLNKILKQIEINKGLIIALENIDNIIDIIKKSNSEEEVFEKFSQNYNLDREQSVAIINMKLQKLMKLEKIKILKKIEELSKEKEKLEKCLNDKEVFDDNYISELDRIKKEYNDERRTQIINLDFESEDEDAEPIEEKQLLIHFTNLGNIYAQESTTLLASKRGGKGTKVKLLANEAIINTINDDNLGNILAFSNKGQMYYTNTDNLPVGQRINVKQLFELENDENITAITTFKNKNNFKYFVFITKQGMIKKTESLEYGIKRGNKLKAINLNDNDEVVSVHFVNEENIGILTKGNNFINIETSSIAAIGKNSKGVKAIKLNLNDEVISSKKINSESKYIIAVSKNGLIKKANIEDFPVCSRDTKGKKISGTRDNDTIIDFLVLSNDNEVILSSKKQIIKINTLDLSVLSREATGVKAIDLKENDFVKGLTL